MGWLPRFHASQRARTAGVLSVFVLLPAAPVLPAQNPATPWGDWQQTGVPGVMFRLKCNGPHEYTPDPDDYLWYYEVTHAEPHGLVFRAAIYRTGTGYQMAPESGPWYRGSTPQGSALLAVPCYSPGLIGIALEYRWTDPNPQPGSTGAATPSARRPASGVVQHDAVDLTKRERERERQRLEAEARRVEAERRRQAEESERQRAADAERQAAARFRADSVRAAAESAERRRQAEWERQERARQRAADAERQRAIDAATERARRIRENAAAGQRAIDHAFDGLRGIVDDMAARARAKREEEERRIEEQEWRDREAQEQEEAEQRERARERRAQMAERDAAAREARMVAAQSPEKAQVVGVEMGRIFDSSTGQIVDTTREFRSADTVYATIRTTGGGSILVTRFNLPSGRWIDSPDYLVNEQGGVVSSLPLQGLPAGQYATEVFLDGQLTWRGRFTVKNPLVAKRAAPAISKRAYIAAVDVGRSIDDAARIASQTSEFGPTDTAYVSLQVRGASPMLELATHWVFEDGQVVANLSQLIAPTGGISHTEFHISQRRGLPKGKYKVHVFLDGTFVKTATFVVK